MTPACKPRQPACSAATSSPFRLQSRIGKQSALITTAIVPGLRVIAEASVETGTPGVRNFRTITGTGGSDTLAATDSTHVWTIAGENAGEIDGVEFIGFENLLGGAGSDLFEFAETGQEAWNRILRWYESRNRSVFGDAGEPGSESSG